MSRVDLQPAFVLHRRPFRNTSLIIDLLTLEYGRVALVGRGARGGKKNSSGQLQPFRQLLVSWRGKGELFSMTGVEEVAATGEMIPSGEGLLCAYYVNELAMKLLPRDDPHPEVFAIYNDTLQNLSESTTDLEPALRRYEIALLAALGYQLVFDHDVETDKAINSDDTYQYIPDRGPTVRSDESQASFVSISGSTLNSLMNDDYSSAVTRKESRRLLRTIIDRQLDGRPLKSRELFLSMRQSMAGNAQPTNSR